LVSIQKLILPTGSILHINFKGSKLNKDFFIVFAFLFLLIVVIFLAHDPILLAFGDFLVIQDDLQPADVIHVIAGRDHRTDYAIELYKQDYGKQIFFTGGWCDTHGYHGERGRRLALEQGVLLESIAIDDTEVNSTYAEAERLKIFVDQSLVPVHSVIVVSDPFHMRRARWTYHKLLGDRIELQMAPVPFDLSPYQRRWWTGWESKMMVMDEYQKIAYYYARYQFSWGSLREWLASLDQN
jgi:uncharacterized SAM-binding protein YcdF (DUF218 family)